MSAEETPTKTISDYEAVLTKADTAVAAFEKDDKTLVHIARGYLRKNPTLIPALVLLIAASAPPAALLSMFAARFGKDTALTSSLVSVQTAISALTMPVLVGLAEVLG